MLGAFASVMLLYGVVWLVRLFSRFQVIPMLPDRRRRHAPVVAGQGLAITNGEVHASRILESLVRLVCPLGNGTSTCLAKGVSTRRAVGADARDSGQANMAGPHR